MTVFQAIIYGIVQGITEWLPISSTAHLRILPALAGWEDPGAAFTAVIQLGTTVALFIYFWKDIKAAFVGWFQSLYKPEMRDTPEARMGWAVFLGTIPVVLGGLFLKHQIEGPLRSLYVIAATLVVMGVGMLWAESRAKGELKIEHTEPKHGLIIGLFQALALIPGMSRSGSTITGALFSGFDRMAAARLSFLLSVPSITLAGLKELYDERTHLGQLGTVPILVATVVSFVVGYASIAWLLKFIQNNSFRSFVYYRFALAGVLLILIWQGLIK